MTNYSTNAARGSDSPEADAALNVDIPSYRMQSSAPEETNLIPTAGADEAVAERAPLGTCSVRSTDPNTAGQEICDSDSYSTVKVMGIEELGRRDQSTVTYWKPPFLAEKGLEGSISEIMERAALVRAPFCATPAPTRTESYGSTEELFRRIQNAIASQTFQSERITALLTYWAISTWCTDALSVAPCLLIVGPPYEGDLVLRALRNLCRNPLLMSGVSVTALKRINWHVLPTLLCFSPHLTAQVASFLSCSTTRNYLVDGAGNLQDFYCAKAVYIGEQASADLTPRCGLQIEVLPTVSACASQKASRLVEQEAQEMQNRLLKYRLQHLVRVYNSAYDACGLTSETRAIANSLGACIVDSPELQSQLLSLLAPVEMQRITDRSTGIEAVILEATINLCHQAKVQFLVCEITAEVNSIAKARGERLIYSAEMVGHRLRRLGLTTRRLGKAGKGLVMDLATATELHRLATFYGAGVEQEESNLHCPLCAKNKAVM